MVHACLRLPFVAAVLPLLCAGLVWVAAGDLAPVAAQEPAAAAEVKEKFSGRLPKFYGLVVSGLQKEDIYKIQAGYATKIDALEAQLLALKRERDAKVAAVLTPEQKQRVLEYEQAELKERQKELQAAAGTTPKSAADSTPEPE